MPGSVDRAPGRAVERGPGAAFDGAQALVPVVHFQEEYARLAVLRDWPPFILNVDVLLVMQQQWFRLDGIQVADLAVMDASLPA